jgi:hypothetical protein
MMDRLRIPFFVAALIAFLLAVLTELAVTDLLVWLTSDRLDPASPGLAIRYLAILDGLILYTVCTMALGIVLPRSVVGRTQGVVTLVLSFFSLLGVIVMILLVFGLLMLMVSLLVAIPFGTIAYMAAWGHFATGAAAATLLILMVLKIVFCICLVLAHQRFLQNKGLIILTSVSLGATWVVAFLHAFPPGFLVSIADAIGALVISIVGAVWLLFLLIGSILATLTAIRTVRFSSQGD